MSRVCPALPLIPTAFFRDNHNDDRQYDCRIVMKLKTELFLYRLLWIGSAVLSPVSILSPRPFLEGGALSRSLLRQVQRLEELQLLAKERNEKYGHLLRLTEQGGKLFSNDHWTSRWQSTWSGSWTLALFDIEEKERALRSEFRRKLQDLRFGCLQKSVWISPFPQTELVNLMKKGKPGCGHFTLMEARELLDTLPATMVQAAWNWKRYAQDCRLWGQRLRTIEDLLHAGNTSLIEWNLALNNEFFAWQEILKSDPFLPIGLQPKHYPSPKLWSQRSELMKKSLTLPLLRQS